MTAHFTNIKNFFTFALQLNSFFSVPSPLSNIFSIDSSDLNDLSVFRIDTLSVNDTTAIDTLRLADPSAIFGSSDLLASTYTSDQPLKPYIIAESNSWQMASAILIAICLFSFVLHRYSHQLRLMFKNLGSVTATFNMLENPSRDFAHFINLSRLLLLLSLSISATSLLSVYYPTIELVYYIAITVSVLILFLASWMQNLLNRVCGVMSDQKIIFAQVRKLGNFDAALFTFIYTPLAMITTMSNAMSVWMVVLIAIFAIYHVIRVFTYLKYEKFSFLQWFLYLCGVEILPITIFIGLAVRLASSLVIS